MMKAIIIVSLLAAADANGNRPFVGDANAAKSVAAQIATKTEGEYTLVGNSVRTLEYNNSFKLDEFLREANMSSAHKFIVVGAGEAPISALKTIKEELGDRAQISWSSHQLPGKAYYDAIGTFDIKSLPAYAANEDEFKSFEAQCGKVTKTFGIPHITTSELLQEHYNSLQQEFAPHMMKNDKINVMILGGNAAIPGSKETKEFTVQDANSFALIVNEYFESGRHPNEWLYVTNTGRTGQHLPIPKTKARGFDTTDSISAGFLNSLTDTALKHVRFFDSRTSASQFYRGVLEATRMTEGIAYIPIESSSMLTEAFDVGLNLHIATHSASLIVHQHQAAMLAATGKAQIIGPYASTIEPWQGEIPSQSKAADAIAEANMALLRG